MILSDIRIGASEAEGRGILLKNGDVMNGVVKEVRDNTLVTESDLGRLDLSFAQVEVVQFGGDYAPVKAAGRVRLRNGAAIHLASFHCDGTELTGKSDVLGDVKIPATALSELIFDPLPLRTLPPVQELRKQPNGAVKVGDAVRRDWRLETTFCFLIVIVIETGGRIGNAAAASRGAVPYVHLVL